MANRALSKVQYGKEVTRGTAVAATKHLAGAEIKGIPADRQPVFIEDALGVRAKTARVEIFELLAKNTLSVPNGYFQALPLFGICGLKGGVSASETTPSQADYLFDFSPSLTGDNAPNSVTLELGDDVQAYEIEHVQFEKLKISGEPDQDGGGAPVAIEGDYYGRQVTPTTFTGALSIPTMTTMNAKLARLYKDTLWADVGTTEVVDVLRKFELEIITGLHPKMMGSANKYFNKYGESYIEVMLTLTLEGTSAADAFFDDYQAATARAYSLQINGPQIGSGSNHQLKVDLFAVPEMVEPLSAESKGNNLHEVLLHGIFDLTGTAMFNFKVTTNTNAI